MERTMYFLDQKDMPTHWYNIQADLPEPLPPLRHPAAKEPTRLPPPLFPEALNEQEFSKERCLRQSRGRVLLACWVNRLCHQLHQLVE